MLLIYLSCAWVAGIFLGEKFNLPPPFILLGLIPLPLSFITRRYRKLIILTSLCLLTFLAGVFYFQSNSPVSDIGSVQFYNERGTVEIRGIVDRDPEQGDRTTHLHLSVREINAGGEWREVSGTALLYVPRYPTYSYGDMLLVTGDLETPPRFDDFDYEAYLAHQEIYSTMLYPEIELVEQGRGFKPLGWIYSLRNKLSLTIARVLPEPQASLAQGIILGLRGNIPSELRADFARTGTAHLLAISGLHLSIVAGMLLSFGIWLFGRRRYIYVWLALGGIWLFALLTGMHPPVLRAVIMVSIFLSAELLGRQRNAITALSFAAAIMVGISPLILRDASFQMSFMAMTGLIFVFPPLQSLSRNAVRKILGEDGTMVSTANFVVDSLSVSMAAIIAVWPLIAYYFGIISPVAPLATFFSLLALPGIIISGALAGGLGLIALPVAQVIAWLAWLFTSYLLLVINVFTAVPFIESSRVPGSLVWIYYSVFAIVIWLGSNRRKMADLMPKVDSVFSGLPRKWVIPPLLVIAILVSATAAALPDEKLHTSFLDVGDGDAILIQRGTRQILVDGGPSPQAITLALGKEMPFWDRTIDLVILTHPHADHIIGLIEVLNRYRVGQVLYSELEYDSDVYDEWLRLLEEKKVDSTPARAGQQIEFGADVTLEVLNPQTPVLSGTESDIDNNGIVLRLEMGAVSFLLTADAMWQLEYELIARRANLKATILKVAHHGSSTSTTPEFLSVVDPQMAIISVGEDNPYGHPTSEVMERLIAILGLENIYRTDEHGTTEFITDGERLWIKSGSK